VAAVVPPPPSISGSGIAKSGGRLIALSIHPAMASAKLEAPAGNRRGSFAATPQGKAGAAGTPDVAGTDHAPGSTNSGSRNDAPAGLYVGAGSNPKTSAIGGNGQGSANDGGTDSSGRSKDSVLMAKATPPHVSSRPQRQAEAVSGNGESDLEKKVFGDRKFYSMTLNIPNLNSAGGSWVVHFAELNGVDVKNQGNLTAPSPTIMSDPAYPLELMKQHVQGTVTLYAIIGSDGSVSGVRVLNGVDDRLDQYASEALQRWHFRPATKDGSPVALEAVVKIPFRAARMRSSF
jgi:TonB family protein